MHRAQATVTDRSRVEDTVPEQRRAGVSLHLSREPDPEVTAQAGGISHLISLKTWFRNPKYSDGRGGPPGKPWQQCGPVCATGTWQKSRCSFGRCGSAVLKAHTHSS